MLNEMFSPDNPERTPIRWLVDMTIGYVNQEGAAPDMIGMVIGWRQPQDMHIHYRIYDISDVPREKESLMLWMVQRYEEKEQLLVHLDKYGQFPAEGEINTKETALPSKRVRFDWIQVVMWQFFFLTSAMFHYFFVLIPVLDMWNESFQIFTNMNVTAAGSKVLMLL